MPRNTLPALLIAMTVGAPGAFGLGLGDITLDSSLNEPLRATIALDAARPGDLANFEATIASVETFRRYGLSRPEFLNRLRFELARVNDRTVLNVTSAGPITEPFVTFLLEANWDSGRMLREYTVLLDPPVFSVGGSTPPVEAPRSAAAQPQPGAGVIQPSPAPAPAPAAETTRAAPATQGSDYGPVKRNETLWAIANRARAGTDLTINQMMIAIYNANPDAFLGNINLLKEGSTLTLPSAANAARISRQDAFAQARDHNQRWRASTPVRSASQPTASTPAPGPARDDRRLRLRAPDSPAGDADAELRAELDGEREKNDILTDEIDALREELAENERIFNLRNAELAELQAQLADGDRPTEPVEAVEPEASIATQIEPTADASDAPAVLADAAEVASDAQPPSDPAPDSQPVPDPAPVSTADIAPPADTSDTGLVSKIVALWPAVLGLLAVLAGVALWRSRKTGAVEEDNASWEALSNDSAVPLPDESDLGAVEVAQGDDPASYLEDTGTFKPIDFSEAESDAGLAAEADSAEEAASPVEFPFEDTLAGDDSVALDQSDPLAEADFHIAYGLYDQAAELITGAAEREPDRRDLKLKLLEIYFVWGNKNAFLDAATVLREEMGAEPDGDWNKVAIMGRQICPDVDLFSGDDLAAASAVDLQLDETGVAPLDLATETVAEETEMDFDLGSAVEAAEQASAADNVIDFDFSNQDDETDDDPLASRLDDLGDDTDNTSEINLDDLGLDIDLSGPDAIDEPLTAPQSVETGATGVVEALDIDAGDDLDALFGGLDDATDDAEPNVDAAVVEGLADEPIDETRDVLLDTSQLKVEMEELLAGAEGFDEENEVPTPAPASDATGSFSAEIKALADDGDAVELPLDTEVDDDDTELLLGPSIDDTHEGKLEADFSADVFGSDDATVLTPALSDLADDTEGDDAPATTAADGFDAAISDDDFSDIFAEHPVEEPDADAFVGDDATVLIKSPLLDGDNGTTRDDLTFQGVVDSVDGEDDDVFNGVDSDSTQESLAVDLDVGDPLFEDGVPDVENTTMRVAAQDLALPDIDDGGPSEVGTKLDLARAYMEMGDPDGARGILEEVIEEGDDGQRQDARALLDALP
ncbi:MAG: FimV/HubP family polar landmark protein [Pseudomonadota bacterium]